LYEWLKVYQDLEDQIAFLELNLENSKNELKRWVEGDLVNVKLSADSNSAKLEEHIERIEYELACKMNDLFKTKKLIKRFKGIEHHILFGKYVEGKTLEHVAEDLGYSSQYIYLKHAQIKRMTTFAEKV
jgi:DNA-directed RNA polymerase specialized sigma subunit